MAKSPSKGRSSSAKSTPSRIKVEVDRDSSLSVRQIQNGFIVSESGTTGKGRNKEYYSKEFFSKTNPVKIGGLGNGGSSNGGGMKFGGKK